MTSSEPRILRLPDGRGPAYQCHRDSGGRPLFFFDGCPGSHLHATLAHAPAPAVGLVAADRSGFGLCALAAERRIVDRLEDVAQLAGPLGQSRFGVIGVSCGGPYAPARPLLLGKRLDHVGLRWAR